MLNNNQYKLVNVTKDDYDLLFIWANDYEVRANSFNTDEIKYDEHVKWFESKLKQDTSSMYILEIQNKKIGLVRLDKILAHKYLINYSIAREYRGQGYGTILLKLIKEKYNSNLLIGKVKKDNIASIRAFKNAGYYMRQDSEIYTFYSKNFEL
ncbi:GNAT family N-acetyltransferase [Clostridium sp. Cult2]|uniref:GNAT family N-acetyltransferase n=1 Tax=Clostridium sp. Cult2 TaxID=2079003 RepID=UPI001F3C7A94|nr:GNAT family N-acetyltransferase [Clostridium sp. Cult2]MCF6465227.1 hypothetical protein [Clostridium sp. Cult2]